MASKPWGHLEALKIPLGNSEEIFADRPVRLQAPHWFFEGFSSNQLAELMDACGLDAKQKSELLNPSRWQIASNGCRVLPANALVRSFSAGSRQQLYAVLAHSSSNYAQCFPFRFALENLGAHFAESGLSVDTQLLLRSLCYTNGGTLCFADLQCLPELLPREEFDEVIDFLYRFPAYRLRLRVYPDSDIDALVKYWGKGNREKKIRPLLESLTKVPATNGASISIGYLLPPFARLRLNTFPEAWTEPQVAREDCFWTSMNFFNEQPDMRFLDSSSVRQALQTEYVPVQQPTYGDLVTVVSERGDGLHMCVYIADDFVFTKNGMNQLQPWVLMKMSDMLLGFPSEKGPRLVLFRRKQA
ncbi:MAG TPA: hypothetical protein VNT26_02025 [Candidatus Sulfotelmatobacter sp.]|nr:hypothetical protein [Candidatus Sulfotelmatobacter sp.]